MIDFLELGDCPNLHIPTMGGYVFWETLEIKAGMELQKNYFTKHCRIISGEYDNRIAWGSETVMREKLKRLGRKEFLEPGDIIGVTRKQALNLYDHYAVYIGNDQVIHYSTKGCAGDFFGEVTIHQAPIKDFLQNDENFFVLFFEDDRHAPKKIYRKSEMLTGDAVLRNQLIYSMSEKFHLYSPEETIERAKSKIGEAEYNLATNNCEHFALWCKTGVATSFQVKKVAISFALGGIRGVYV